MVPIPHQKRRLHRPPIQQKVESMPTKMMIAGEWRDSSGGKEKEIRNPATGEVVDTVVEATESDIGSAIDAAEEAFKAWAAMPPPRRAEIVDKGARLILDTDGVAHQFGNADEGKDDLE